MFKSKISCNYSEQEVCSSDSSNDSDKAKGNKAFDLNQMLASYMLHDIAGIAGVIRNCGDLLCAPKNSNPNIEIDIINLLTNGASKLVSCVKFYKYFYAIHQEYNKKEVWINDMHEVFADYYDLKNRNINLVISNDDMHLPALSTNSQNLLSINSLSSAEFLQILCIMLSIAFFHIVKNGSIICNIKYSDHVTDQNDYSCNSIKTISYFKKVFITIRCTGGIQKITEEKINILLGKAMPENFSIINCLEYYACSIFKKRNNCALEIIKDNDYIDYYINFDLI